MQVVINMDSRFLRRVAIGASLALAVAIIVIPAATDAGSVTVPHQFVNGTVADANEVNANLSAIATGVNDNDGQIRGVVARTTALEARLMNLEGVTLADLLARFDNVESSVTGIEGRLINLEGVTLPGLTTRVDSLETMLGELATEVESPCENSLDRFTDNGDGTITDRCSGLMWHVDLVLRDFAQAVQFVDALAVGGHLDWRLPTLPELNGLLWTRPALLDGAGHTSTLHPQFVDLIFPPPPTEIDRFVWSSTRSPGDTRVWGLNPKNLAVLARLLADRKPRRGPNRRQALPGA